MNQASGNVTCCDVLIVGGGLVGASLACALEGSGLNVALAEATPAAHGAAPGFDERNLALARASVNALTALGVLPRLVSPPTPIRRIHVSSRGDFGVLRLSAARHGVDAFGAVVVARELGAALEARLTQLSGLVRYRPARLLTLEPGERALRARFAGTGVPDAVSARLVVGADGTASRVRAQLGIEAVSHDYRQRLFVAVVALTREHANIAYERFTPEGPVAFLPLSGHRMGSVCTVAEDVAATVAALDEDAYREFLQARFGYRLGRFGRIGERSAYALALTRAGRLHARRGVLVGNAAQTLHPVAAQGFNLGLRDALILAEELRTAAARGDDPGCERVLARYAERRAVDREATLRFSDGLARLMSNPRAPVRVLRSLGLLALDRLPGAAGGLVRAAMGFRGDVPRLAFGGDR